MVAWLKRYWLIFAVGIAVLYFRNEIGNALPAALKKPFKFG